MKTYASALVLFAAAALARSSHAIGELPYPPILGQFATNGDLHVKQTKDGVTTKTTETHEPHLAFFPAQGAYWDSFVGSWKSLKQGKYAADFSTAYQTQLEAFLGTADVSAKLKLKHIEILGDALGAKVRVAVDAKQLGSKIKIRGKGSLLGHRLPPEKK